MFPYAHLLDNMNSQKRQTGKYIGDLDMNLREQYIEGVQRSAHAVVIAVDPYAR